MDTFGSFPYLCLGAYLTFGASDWDLFRRGWGGGGGDKKNCGKSLGLQRTEVLPNFQAGLKLISILSLFKISYSCEMSFS